MPIRVMRRLRHILPVPNPLRLLEQRDTFISIQSSKAILYNFCAFCFFLRHIVVGASKAYEEYNAMCAILLIWHCVSGLQVLAKIVMTGRLPPASSKT